jgi:hypothetical protein
VTRATGFSLLNILNVESVVTDIEAVTDGVKATVKGGTKVVGATIAGRKVTIDAKGVHGLSNVLNTLLKRAGISAHVLAPVKASAGSAAQLASSGLRIDLDLSSTRAPALDALFDVLPPLENPAPGAPSVEDLIAAFRAHHIVGITVGGGAVTIDARKAATFDAPDVLDETDDFIPSLDLAPTDLLSPLSPSVALPRAGSTTSTARPLAFPFGDGIAGLIVLALLAQPLIGYRLAKAAGSILGLGAATTCTEDEP